MKASNLIGAADTVQQQIYWTFMYLSHAWSMPIHILSFTILLNVCDLKAAEIFLLKPTGWGGKAAWIFFIVNTLRCLRLVNLAIFAQT
jgi:hypothetical protein